MVVKDPVQTEGDTLLSRLRAVVKELWRRFGYRSHFQEEEQTRMRNTGMTMVFVSGLMAIIGTGGYLIFTLSKGSPDPELMMGLLIVVAIATLMTVLFIVAAGFSAMNLTDPRQALALPEGSIRAMIALVLIMIFIIFGIFLFRKVGTASQTYVGWVASAGDAKVPVDKAAILTLVDQNNLSKGYYVYVLEPMNDEGKRLAQQLMTTVGTLVVAISSFYFGSTLTAASKKEKEDTSTGASAITISGVVPKEAARGGEITLAIAGMGFVAPRAVRLIRGSEVMSASGVTFTNTALQAKVLIDKEPGDKWDLVVENGDGSVGRLPKVFEISHT